MKVAQQNQSFNTEALEPALIFWCPACGERHRVTVAPGRWSWNGDPEKPTIGPSVKVTWTFGPSHTPRCCHFHVENGEIKYCNDCTHELNNQTVPMHDVNSHGESLTEFPEP